MIYWVIVEGPDNIGKTTLCNDLLSRLKQRGAEVAYAHFGAPKAKTKKAQIAEQKLEASNVVKAIENLSRLYRHKDIVLLHDRSIFGELVYCKYRNYEADYSDMIERLHAIPNLQTIMFSMYGDATTISKFSLSAKTDNASKYAKMSKMESISIGFIDKLHAIDYGRVVVINSNNYDSFDDRNNHVWDITRAFINNKSYVFKPTGDYQNTPFNHKQNLYNSDHGFTNNIYSCNDFPHNCGLGTEHLRNCESNTVACHPIAGYGSANAKYIFVGEVSHYNKRVTTFLPFYNSASGCLFQQMLYNLNISPFDVYITNVFKCTPKDNKLGEHSKSSVYENMTCVGALKSEIAMMAKPKATVIAISKLASNIILDSSDRQFKDKFRTIYIPHPSYYLRLGKPEDFINDIAHKLSMHNLYKDE